jgi:hypothetical protein
MARLKACEGDLRKLPHVENEDSALAFVVDVAGRLDRGFGALLNGEYDAVLDQTDKYLEKEVRELHMRLPAKVPLQTPLLLFELDCIYELPM